MSEHSAPPLNRVSILATDGVFASMLMQARDFLHMASLRFGKQEGLGLTPLLQTRLVSPDGQPVHTFSGDVLSRGRRPRRIRTGDSPRLLGQLRPIARALSTGHSLAARTARRWQRDQQRGRRRLLAGRSRSARRQGSDHLLALLRRLRRALSRRAAQPREAHHPTPTTSTAPAV